ncbi:hypothetical protein SAMN07250955_101107 [Arboricoccus pini]|uniref:Uncharacterized protein n=1 Tax=Arboricoccus pini TaxID=1963835 RepID=A0A212PX20_9PROT|nr:hypothetical protein [Arboricoccus pini]SNB51597.1 hypothetical protein SAMN07250955_101107 [Arboricoccus pini]
MLTVRIHDLEQGRAVLDLAAARGTTVRLATAEGALSYLGVGYVRALEEALGVPLLADCGDEAGTLMAGLRTGLAWLCYKGQPAILARLRDMAAQKGALVLDAIPEPVMALEARDRGARRLALYLAALPGEQAPAENGARQGHEQDRQPIPDGNEEA